jgi:hypothetical protein
VRLYFLLLDAEQFEKRLVPPLAAAWRQRSFEPCRPLAEWLLPAAAEFRAGLLTGPTESLLARVANGLPFDRRYWRLLAAEVLVLAAVEMPEIETAPQTLQALLAPESLGNLDRPRDRFTPIEQVHFGTHDLAFGGAVYRPDHAGLNALTDVRRLREYLDALDPGLWCIEDLARRNPDPADCAEELDFAREWFGPLCDLYRRAAARGEVVICEQI